MAIATTNPATGQTVREFDSLTEQELENRIHEPYERSNDRFDPQRTGLDHLAITVDDRATLDAWTTHLDAHDVEHSPVRDAGYAEFVSFGDPDAIAWEIWLPTP